MAPPATAPAAGRMAESPAVAKRASALPASERRATIIAAIRPLLIEYGESVTTKQIACAAGIAEGTIFRVFADKDELLDAALEAALDPEPLELALRTIDPTLAFDEKLVAATTMIQQRVVDVWMLVSHLGPKRHHKASRPITDSAELASIFAAHSDRLSVDADAAAHMLRALTLSLTHPMLAGHAARPDEIVHVLLHGIGNGTQR